MPSRHSRFGKRRTDTWPTWGSSCGPCIGSRGYTWERSRPSAVWSSIPASFEACRGRGPNAMGARAVSRVGRPDEARPGSRSVTIRGTALVLVLLTTPLAAGAQPAAKLYRIGWLGNAPYEPADREAFIGGLRERGW